MFCLKCGKEVLEGAKFCGHCGADIWSEFPDSDFEPIQEKQPAVPPKKSKPKSAVFRNLVIILGVCLIGVYVLTPVIKRELAKRGIMIGMKYRVSREEGEENAEKAWDMAKHGAFYEEYYGEAQNRFTYGPMLLYFNPDDSWTVEQIYDNLDYNYLLSADEKMSIQTMHEYMPSYLYEDFTPERAVEYCREMTNGHQIELACFSTSEGESGGTGKHEWYGVKFIVHDFDNGSFQGFAFCYKEKESSDCLGMQFVSYDDSESYDRMVEYLDRIGMGMAEHYPFGTNSETSYDRIKFIEYSQPPM